MRSTDLVCLLEEPLHESLTQTAVSAGDQGDGLRHGCTEMNQASKLVVVVSRCKDLLLPGCACVWVSVSAAGVKIVRFVVA